MDLDSYIDYLKKEKDNILSELDVELYKHSLKCIGVIKLIHHLISNKEDSSSRLYSDLLGDAKKMLIEINNVAKDSGYLEDYVEIDEASNDLKYYHPILIEKSDKIVEFYDNKYEIYGPSPHPAAHKRSNYDYQERDGWDGS